MNSRLDEIQAAILRVKLRHLEAENAARRRLAAIYDRRSRRHGTASCPTVRSGATHVWHQYVVRSARRDALKQALQEQGIGTLIHYPVPVHAQPAYRGRSPLIRPGSPTPRPLARDS